MSYLFVADGSLPAPDMLRTGQYHVPHYASGSVLWNAPVSVELCRTVYAQCTCYHLHKASGPSAAVVGVSPPSRVPFGLPGFLESSSCVVCQAHTIHSPLSTKLLSRERLEGSLRTFWRLLYFLESNACHRRNIALETRGLMLLQSLDM